MTEPPGINVRRGRFRDCATDGRTAGRRRHRRQRRRVHGPRRTHRRRPTIRRRVARQGPHPRGQGRRRRSVLHGARRGRRRRLRQRRQARRPRTHGAGGGGSSTRPVVCISRRRREVAGRRSGRRAARPCSGPAAAPRPAARTAAAFPTALPRRPAGHSSNRCRRTATASGPSRTPRAPAPAVRRRPWARRSRPRQVWPWSAPCSSRWTAPCWRSRAWPEGRAGVLYRDELSLATGGPSELLLAPLQPVRARPTQKALTIPNTGFLPIGFPFPVLRVRSPRSHPIAACPWAAAIRLPPPKAGGPLAADRWSVKRQKSNAFRIPHWIHGRLRNRRRKPSAPGAGATAVSSWVASSRVSGYDGDGGMYCGGCSR